MEVVLLLVGILGVALIVVPRMQRRRAGVRKPAPARRRTRTRKSAKPQVAATASPVATWTPAEAAASRAGDWEVWDDELGWEGVESAPATRQPEPAAEAEPEPEPEPEPERAPDRQAWERFRAKQLSDDGHAPVEPEPAVAGGELPSVERWRERQVAPGEWADDDGLGWEGEATQAEPVALQRDEAAPVRNGNGNGRASQVDVTRFEPAVRASVRAPEETESAPPAAVAGREWLSETAWEAHGTPATQTEGGSDGNGNGHATAVAAAPRRGRRRLSPVALVAIYAAAGIGVVVLASTVLLGGSSNSKPKPAATPQATATGTVAAATATATPAPSATPDPAVAAAERKAKAAARSFRGAQAAAVRRQHRAVADARRAYRRHQAQLKRQRRDSTPVPTAPVATPPPAATAVPYTPAPSNPSPSSPPPNRCEFCIG
jgi:hypothetical protein